MTVFADRSESRPDVENVGSTPRVVVLRPDEGERRRRFVVGRHVARNEFRLRRNVGQTILGAGSLRRRAAGQQGAGVAIHNQHLVDVVGGHGVNAAGWRASAGVALRAVDYGPRHHRSLDRQAGIELEESVDTAGVDAARRWIHRQMAEASVGAVDRQTGSRPIELLDNAVDSG